MFQLAELFSLKGKRALATGSSRGLGRAIASRASSYVNGQMFYVDGGMLASM